MIHVDVWQKPTQYCKAIILQLKINKFLKAENNNNTHTHTNKPHGVAATLINTNV